MIKLFRLLKYGFLISVALASGAALYVVGSTGVCLFINCPINEFKKRHWQIESADDRNKLPEYKVRKAVSSSELTASILPPDNVQFSTWSRSHGDLHGTKYSNLSSITRANVRNLAVAWEYRSGADYPTMVQANPVIVDGLLFTPTAGSNLVALDAKSGVEKWRFSPGAPPAKRGLLWWKNPKTSRGTLYFAAGKSLFALDAKTGKPVTTFGDGGSISGISANAAPVVSGSLLIVATLSATIDAFDVFTGKRVWQRSTKKKEPRLHRGGGRFNFSGAQPWAGMALDSERGIVFVTLGNPRPVFYGAERPGDNLYSNSIIALKAATGDVIWHFQEIPHGIWDLDIAAPPLLTTIEREGRRVDVVVAISKIGNTIVLDRVTGGLVFDFRLRRAPTSTTPGERTAPYQPDVETPKPLTPVAFSLDDITDIGPKNEAYVGKILRRATMGFFEPPVMGKKLAMYALHGGAQWPGAASNPYSGIMVVPSNRIPWMINLFYGAKDESWFPPSKGEPLYQDKCGRCHGTNREGVIGEGLSFVPPLTGASVYLSKTEFDDRYDAVHSGVETSFGLTSEQISTIYDHFNFYDRLIEMNPFGGLKVKFFYRMLWDNEGYPGSKPPWGLLTAIDLNTGKTKWQVPFGEYEDLSKKGVPVTGQQNFGGAILTAGGLVFATGTSDNKIRAFDEDTGGELWSYTLPFGGSAPPATFEVDGEQYLVVQATGGSHPGFGKNGDAIVAFKIK